jgi:hypothetical protein
MSNRERHAHVTRDASTMEIARLRRARSTSSDATSQHTLNQIFALTHYGLPEEISQWSILSWN